MNKNFQTTKRSSFNFKKIKPTAAAVLLILVFINSLFSQNKGRFFQPKFTWTTIDQAALLNPDDVRHLKITKKNMSGFPHNIAAYKNLESLSLAGLKLSALPNQVFELSNLKFLDLSKNKFETISDSICSLHTLEILIINRNPLAYLPQCLGKELKGLQAIDLYETEVSNLPDSLESCKTLKFVDFQGIQMRQEEIDSLKKRFPMVKFAFDPPCNCFK